MKPASRPQAARTTSVLGTIVAALAAGMLSCGGDPGPLQVSIADVVQRPDVYVLDRITTSGTVVNEKGRRSAYALTDGNGNRLLVTPASLVKDRVGKPVTATGVFVRDLGVTPTLNATAIRPDQAR